MNIKVIKKLYCFKYYFSNSNKTMESSICQECKGPIDNNGKAIDQKVIDILLSLTNSHILLQA